MSLAAIARIIKDALPKVLQPFFFVGARNLVAASAPTRIVMVYITDAFAPRAHQQGKPSNTPEIFGVNSTVEFHINAPTQEAIEQPQGLRDLLLSICFNQFGASLAPVAGEWDLEQGSQVATKGEHYVLRLIFKQPVVDTDAVSVKLTGLLLTVDGDPP